MQTRAPNAAHGEHVYMLCLNIVDTFQLSCITQSVRVSGLLWPREIMPCFGVYEAVRIRLNHE